MPTHFADALALAVDRTGSVLCVGLDPVLESLPQALRSRHHEPLAALREFCIGVVESVAGVVPVIKPQAACFERFGAKGVVVLEDVCSRARERGLLVLLDAKRGDIGISANHYAAAACHCGAHAITVNAYLGPSTVEPYLDAGLGVFVLVRTSNADSDVVQSPALGDGRTVAGMMADHVRRLGESRVGACGLSSVGAVVGATKSADAAMLRERMPAQVFLIPGFGAQGGTAQDIARMRRHGAVPLGSMGVLVNASRSVIYPADAGGSQEWSAAVALAARRTSNELSAALVATPGA